MSYFDADGNQVTLPEQVFDQEGNPVQIAASTEKLVHLSRDQIRSLEDKASKTDEATTTAANATKKLAFYEAGLDMTDPRNDYFQRGYEGEMTPDAIREAAAQAGFIAAPAGEASGEEVDAQTRIHNASIAGASNPDGIPLEDAINAAQTPEEVMSILAESGLPVINQQ